MRDSSTDMARVWHPLFNEEWYRAQGGALKSVDPLADYISGGWRKGLSPHPLFSVRHYLSQRKATDHSDSEPLTHFMTRGWRLGYNPHPMFSLEYYLTQVPNLTDIGIDPLTHYLTVGWREGLKPNSYFEPLKYVAEYADIAESGSEPLTYLVRLGLYARVSFSDIARQKSFEEAVGELTYREWLSPAVSKRKSAEPILVYNLKEWQKEIELPNVPQVVLKKPLGIFLHLYYDGLADEFANYISKIDLPKKIYITTVSIQGKRWIERVFRQRGLEIAVAIVEDKGSDIPPFVVLWPNVCNSHDVFLKIHGKKSLHNPAEFGEKWRHYLLDELMFDASRVHKIVDVLLRERTLGMLFPRHWIGVKDIADAGGNLPELMRLLRRMNMRASPGQRWEYPSGSMFWFRSDAMKELINLNFQWEDFEAAVQRRDGTLAHAIERAFVFFCVKAGRKWGFLPELQRVQCRSKEETLQIIHSSNLFDAEYYRKTYPDVPGADLDLLMHWIEYGHDEGRNPSATFSTSYYGRFLRSLPPSERNSLVHYIVRGQSLGLPTFPRSGVPAKIEVDNIYAAYEHPEAGDDYVQEQNPLLRDSDVRVLAFYLPQFHPFPENDRFWGKGFTEWTNTTKALPMFRGHYQPRLPGELGFYDTRLKVVLHRQIMLAKKYGVHGFCFHHYFFDGKPIMRAPYDLILTNPDLDIPFCLNWANEPWTVRWDGLSTHNGVLLDQRHHPEDDVAFFRDILPALRDRRYITIDGRPLLLLYRPGLFPDMAATIERWSECSRQAGLPDLYLAVVQQAFDGSVDPRHFGFDAAVEYPPHNLGCSVIERDIAPYDPGFPGTIQDYLDASDRALARPEPDYTWFRGIMTGWDCTPRRKNPDIFINATPQRYERWLTELLERTDALHKGEEKVVFVNAWNEWAEGAYLEPDRRYGYAYLDATANAINNFSRLAPKVYGERVLLAAHIFYGDLLSEFADHFANVPAPFDVFVTTTPEQRDYVHFKLKERLNLLASDISVLAVENVGRDFGSFVLNLLPRAANYDLICWTHSKKSPYNTKYQNWRQYLLANLLGNPERIQAIFDTFSRWRRVGLIYSRPFSAVAGKVEWGSNFDLTDMLLRRLGVSVPKEEAPRFATGSMFWFRPSALVKLLELGLTREDFIQFGDGPRDPASGMIVDGTIGHALERMLVYVAEASGYDAQEMSFVS